MDLAKRKKEKLVENISMSIYGVMVVLSAFSLVLSFGDSLANNYILLFIFITLPIAVFKLKDFNKILFITATLIVILFETNYVKNVISELNNMVEIQQIQKQGGVDV